MQRKVPSINMSNNEYRIKGSTVKSQTTFLNDASKIWNKAPLSIKSCETLYTAKKEIKKYITQLPL